MAALGVVGAAGNRHAYGRRSGHAEESEEPVDLNDFNQRWLEAWSLKDVDGVASFYTADTRYVDAQVPQGLAGREALKDYLAGLFGATPMMTYVPEALWEIDGGFCGRWICTIEGLEGEQWLRGFDLCLLGEKGLIAHNEVYTHRLTEKPV